MRERVHACRGSAFTLIELLIVVAIIAILAAIAVPNFLEAQTRAKVSRVKADFRSMGTAVETYAIDYNGRYDMPIGVGGKPGASSLWVKWSLKTLTTPISYISSLPDDPFLPASMMDFRSSYNGQADPGGNAPSSIYQWWDETKGKNQPHKDFRVYFATKASLWYPSFKLCVGHLGVRQWFLISQGPFYVKLTNEKQTPSQFVDWKVHPYDPTNGTMSRGIIVTTGP